MSRPRLLDPVRHCETCGLLLVRKRFPGGRLESHGLFAKRRYCSRPCARIGNIGRPHPSKLTEADFWARIDRRPTDAECWPWIAKSVDKNGYGWFQAKKAHRLAYELTIGAIPPGKLILHSCDNPACCNPRHLRPGTVRENAQDAAERGRLAPPMRGSKHPGARFTEEDVVAIREAVSYGAPRRLFAELFGVSIATIHCIVNRKTWMHV